MGKILLPSITTADRSALLLDVRELVYDTDTDSVWMGDGVTTGGVELVGSGRGNIPTGGTAAQVLSKIDGTDYNTQWVTVSSGGADVLEGQVFS